MKNIQISLIAEKYADALLKIAQDGIIGYDEILNNLEIINQILKNSPDLTEVLANPTIDNNTKNSVIDTVFSKDIHEKIRNFLKILTEKKRFNEYKTIVEAYKRELDKIKNIKRVEVISAIELNKNYKTLIKEKLETRFEKSIVADWNINEEIISGLVIKTEDEIIDSSLKNKLQNLSKNIMR